MWCSRALVARAATSWVAGDSGAASASLRRPPRIARSKLQRRRRQRRRRSGSCGTAPRPRRGRRPRAAVGLAVLAAAHAGVELGTQPFGGEQLPVERRHDERRRALGDRAQRADHHPVELLVRLALQRQLVGGLEHGHPLRRPVEARQHRRQRLDRLGLADDVELRGRGTAAGARGSSARAGRRTATSSCARPWRRRAPCRSRRSAARRCGRPRRACTSAARPPCPGTGGWRSRVRVEPAEAAAAAVERRRWRPAGRASDSSVGRSRSTNTSSP